MSITKSTKVFLGLLAVYAFLAAISLYLPQTSSGLGQEFPSTLPAAKWLVALAVFGLIFIVYGLLGYLGLKLAKKIGIPDILTSEVSHKQRFLFPALAGVISGVVLIIGDSIFSQFNGIGHFVHPAFPASILATISAGIGEEMLFRLFFISFWTWLISRVIFRGKYATQIFWLVAVLSAIVFGLAHYPAIMYLYKFPSFSAVPLGLQIELLSLNGLVSLVAAYFYKKVGYLGAVGVHLWTDVVWHVILGLIIIN